MAHQPLDLLNFFSGKGNLFPLAFLVGCFTVVHDDGCCKTFDPTEPMLNVLYAAVDFVIDDIILAQVAQWVVGALFLTFISILALFIRLIDGGGCCSRRGVAERARDAGAQRVFAIKRQA